MNDFNNMKDIFENLLRTTVLNISHHLNKSHDSRQVKIIKSKINKLRLVLSIAQAKKPSTGKEKVD